MRQRNLDSLRIWANGFRRREALNAVRAGAAVIQAELRRRCPVRTGALRDSIHATTPRAVKWGVTGMVVVGTDHAFAARHAVAATAANDRSRVQHLMVSRLTGAS